jgi:hypothetical protein
VHGVNRVVGDPNDEQFDNLAASIDRLGDRIGRKQRATPMHEASMPPQQMVGYDAEGPDLQNETAGGRLPSDDALTTEMDAMKRAMCEPALASSDASEGVVETAIDTILGVAKGAIQGLLSGNPANIPVGMLGQGAQGLIKGSTEALEAYKGPGVTAYEDEEKQATDKAPGEKGEEKHQQTKILMDATKKLQESWRQALTESPMRAAFGLGGGAVGAYGGQQVGNAVGSAIGQAIGTSISGDAGGKAGGELGGTIGSYGGGIGGGYLGAQGGLSLHDEYSKPDMHKAVEALDPQSHAQQTERAIPQLGKAMESVSELRNQMMRPARRL